MKKRLSAILSPAPATFLGRFPPRAICRARRTIIDAISSNFHLRAPATTLRPAIVGPLQSGRQSRVGGNE